MQSPEDFICVDCRKNFDSASELLKHFAQHVSADILNDLKDTEKRSKRSTVPDLYPISIYRQMQNGDGGGAKEAEAINPLRFCEVTMDDAFQNAHDKADEYADSDSDSSEYGCKFCGYSCTEASLLRSHMKYHKHAKIPGLNPMKMKSRKQQKCNIKRKTYGTKLLHQSNELLCT